MPSRQRSWLARVAAPLAFLVLATLGVVAVRSALEEDNVATTTVTVTTSAETTTTKQPATTTTKGNKKNGKFYRVQEGDTLGSIAAQFGVSVEALQAANGIDDPDEILIGQVLVIP